MTKRRITSAATTALALLLAVGAGALSPNAVAAGPAQTDNAEISIQELDRHGLLADTAADGPAQINDDGSALIHGLAVQPQETGQKVQDQAGLLVVTDTRGSAETVVQNLHSGVRYMSVLKDANAPTEFRYRFPSTTLTMQEDGSVAVQGAGELQAVILPAWAKDANGAAVPTGYEIQGDVLIQHIDHVGSVYPIVADPSVSTCLVGGWRPAVCVKYNRSEVKIVKDLLPVSAGAAAAIATLCGLIPTSSPILIAAKAACTGYFGGRAAEMTLKVNEAWNTNRCLEVRLPVPVYPAMQINVVNC
ncbi:hypothetical protein AB0M79_09755 [Polymorphospora sp. NPDC051019]|uniref:hypothetical protein n=1 Tax=Polymorphospora sp. NPDC051019 TaxID=3155725 RepID=UPI00342E582C